MVAHASIPSLSYTKSYLKKSNKNRKTAGEICLWVKALELLQWKKRFLQAI